eukprot:TRINITY_DN8899_c0_g1_i1.p1 TRINITY_DN8899_c0_g1~~TRINITY_DN8899_c0_g1_i1.p1  ORF type:complete len:693 (-),score=116.41 TRINITY_DN8899_c0_g1_i1:392-2470(-)
MALPQLRRRSRSARRRRSASSSAEPAAKRQQSKDDNSERRRHVATAARSGWDRGGRRHRSASANRESKPGRDAPRATLTARADAERSRSRDASGIRLERGALQESRGPREHTDGYQRRNDGHTSASFGGGRGSGGGRGGSGRGYGGRGALAPPERPGVDTDERLQPCDDDPRYFPNAELGKAQKAALGQLGLSGRNTASFYPKDTLVRPAMRVYYGQPLKRFGNKINVDDVIVVPDFFCVEGAMESFERLQDEVQSLQNNADLELSKLPLCQRAVTKIGKYFSIEEEDISVRVTWYKGGGGKMSPLVHDWGKFKPRSSKGHCLATIGFGATMELAFRRTTTDELLFFPQFNGALSCFARDACLRWQVGINERWPKDGPSAGGRIGHISVSVLGRSSALVEETTLAPAPSDVKKGQDALGGCLGVPCSVERPSLRIITAPPRQIYEMPVKHDDVIIVPEFFCAEDDWSTYYELLKEMRQCQAAGEKKAEWISWHEGAHLLSQNPTGSRTFQRVQDKMCEYFSIAKGNRGTRFNWYRDGQDWKPFHHDSAAFNEARARTQNCTIGISFGASRELAFRHAKTGELLYFPQKNGMLFYFGRDANIIWQHGINALPENEQDGKGRISIILWGLCTTTVDEDGSPPMLTDDSRDGKGKGKGKGGYDGRRNQPCRDFQKGNCTYGDRCRFSHEATPFRR